MGKLRCPWDAKNPVIKSSESPGKKKVGGNDSRKIIKNKIA